jgi:hypothetical protein
MFDENIIILCLLSLLIDPERTFYTQFSRYNTYINIFRYLADLRHNNFLGKLCALQMYPPILLANVIIFK